MLLVYTGPHPFTPQRACVKQGKGKETSKGLKRHLVVRLDAALSVSIQATRSGKLGVR